MQPSDYHPIRRFSAGVAQGVAGRPVKRLVPQATKSFNEDLTGAGWRTIPSESRVHRHPALR